MQLTFLFFLAKIGKKESEELFHNELEPIIKVMH